MKKALSLALMLCGIHIAFAQSTSTLPQPCFQEISNIPLNDAPRLIVLADFNGDTILDIASMLSQFDSVAVLFGNGNGTFTTPVNYPGGTSARGMVSADFDGDGDNDLALANQSRTYTVLLNNGNGTFAAPVIDTISTSIVCWATSITTFDYNLDSIPDLAITSNQTTTPGVHLLRGLGNGTFARSEYYGMGRNTQSMVATDLNNDRFPDMVGTNVFPASVDIVTKYLNDTMGSFYIAQGWDTVGDNIGDIVSADFNSDGNMDLVVTDNPRNGEIFLGNGNGSLALPTTIDMGLAAGTGFMLTEDFNGDGHDDLVAVGRFNDTLVVLLGHGDGTFSSTPYHKNIYGISSIATGDVNGDGAIDIVTSNNRFSTNSLTVLLNTQAPTGAIVDTSAGCQNLGSLGTVVYSGPAPYTYNWNNGDTTAALSNVPTGIYSVTITDANGCQVIDTDTLTSAVIGIDSISVQHETCAGASNGSIDMYVSGGAPPITYQWSTGDTTKLITGLVAGSYTVTLTDASGCFTTQSVTIVEEGLLVDIVVLDSAGGCAGLTDGALAAQLLNGTAPFSYEWSTGNTIDTITGLTAGGYTLTTTDNMGCVNVRHEFVPTDESCYGNISGHIYYDANTNCTHDTGELGLSNIMVVIDSGYYAITNANGQWNARVKAGTYNIYTVGTQLIPTCGIDTLNTTVAAATTYTGIDFPKDLVAPNDVSAALTCGNAILALSQNVNVQIKNRGFFPADVAGIITLDAAITTPPSPVSSPGFVIDSISAGAPYKVYFHYNNLLPQQTAHITVTANIPGIPNVALGQLISHQVSVNLLNATDDDLTNNQVQCGSGILGAYDPNDKQVFADERDANGLAAPEDTLFTYLVRFQNTGNYIATDVFIRDTMDVDLDVASLHILQTSHTLTSVTITEGRIVQFNFDNILLPDSNTNAAASQGFVRYQIMVDDASQLLELTNQAAIYFDFNPPIFTNTTSTWRAEVPEITGDTAMCAGDDIDLSSSLLPQFGYYWANNGTAIPGASGSTVTVADSGNYQLYLTYNGDTLVSDPHTVLQRPLPALQLTPATNSTCIDNSAITIATTPVGGTLSGAGINGGSFYPANAGLGTHLLTYSYTDNNGCSAVAEDSITVNALPTVSLALASDTICTSAQPLDMANMGNPAGGVFSGTGVSNSLLDVSLPGSYVVNYVYTDNNGCAASAQRTAVVDVCSGIDEIGSGLLSIYPNPTNGLLHIELSGQPIDEVLIYNATGTLVLQQTLEATTHTVFNLNQLTAGLHIVRIRSNDSWLQSRIMVVE